MLSTLSPLLSSEVDLEDTFTTPTLSFTTVLELVVLSVLEVTGTLEEWARIVSLVSGSKISKEVSSRIFASSHLESEKEKLED